MNKKELIEEIFKELDGSVPKARCGEVLDAFLKITTSAMVRGDTVKIVKFGNFRAFARSAREAVNPRTGERIRVPECRIVTFKASKSLTEKIN